MLYDGDMVEAHNIPASFYSPTDEGSFKVEALRVHLQAFMPTAAVETHAVMFPHEFHGVGDLDTGVLVLALDSLQARRTIWENLKLCWRETDVRLLIDVRSGMDLITVYAVDLRRDEPYTEYEGSYGRGSMEIPCSARAVAYNSSTCAGLASAVVRAWAMRDPFPRKITVDHKTWFTMAEGLT